MDWQPDESDHRSRTRHMSSGPKSSRAAAPRKTSDRAAAQKIVNLKPRLWSSREGRERWLAALQPVRSVAAVQLALTAFRQHCQAFGVYTEPKGMPRLKRVDAEQALRCFYHSGAFGVEKKKPTGKKK